MRLPVHPSLPGLCFVAGVGFVAGTLVAGSPWLSPDTFDAPGRSLQGMRVSEIFGDDTPKRTGLERGSRAYVVVMDPKDSAECRSLLAALVDARDRGSAQFQVVLTRNAREHERLHLGSRRLTPSLVLSTVPPWYNEPVLLELGSGLVDHAWRLAALERVGADEDGLHVIPYVNGVQRGN